MNLFGAIRLNDAEQIQIQVSIDTENSSIPLIIDNLFNVTWISNDGTIVKWINNVGATVTWVATGTTTFSEKVEASGFFMGMTLQTTAQDLTLLSLALLTQQYKLNTI